MKRLLPDTIFSRLFLLVLAAIVISHLMTFVLLLGVYGDRHRPPGPPPEISAADSPRPAQRPPPPYRRQTIDIAGHSVRTPPPAFWIGLVSQLFALSLAAWLGARMLARPIQKLGQAAAELGVDLNRPPIAETGTAEARQAARVFNRMQQRIRLNVEERGRFLAAVSHDLRTPLTRMKLRVERMQNDALRDKLKEDMAEMAAMLNATLSYLRDEATNEAWQMMDVTALLESMAEDETDAGHDVSSGRAVPLRLTTASA